MLLKYTPQIITAVSFFLAIGLHWFYTRRFWLPSILAAIGSGVTSVVLLRALPTPEVVESVSRLQLIWNNFGFAFTSGLVLALLVGYLMKYAPSLFNGS